MDFIWNPIQSWPSGAVKKETSNRIFFKKIKKLFKSLFLTALPLKNKFQTKPLYSRNLNPWQCIDNERRIQKLIRVTTELKVFDSKS